MRRVSIEDVDPEPYEESLHADRRPLSDPLDTDHVAITRYVLEPGERFSGSVHAHADQEEVFVVLEGEATFDVRRTDGDAGEIVVSEHEAIRFAPGEFQSGRNAGDERLIALVLGAPRATDDVRISRIPVLDDRDVSCPDCGHDSMRVPTDPDAPLECPVCDGTLALE
ncbi:cupin domain-containing protein [Natrarchaeobius oligotrophus]|uniref:Cupin domain-containing protein n=1 Tax=Natrarchaeobius chitinivorans TaxID=1679083 RepID=A0A3N6N0L5_NATCH|nr:cupin domain-containing protein [Natrarchaeobius chitinivorans]RQH01007.1 cupin domain-containing protein [Natrarchaeobius chitinivorans]